MDLSSTYIAIGLFGSLVLSLFLLAKGRVELWILITFFVVVCIVVVSDRRPIQAAGTDTALPYLYLGSDKTSHLVSSEVLC